MQIILIILLICFLILILKHYTIRHDTIIAFTGGLGSGKSLLSVKYSLTLLKKNRNKINFHNKIARHFKKNKEKKELPLLYTSIPIKYKLYFWSKEEYSLELEEEHLLLQRKLNEKSVVFIDEIGSFANQFEYKNPNILDNFNEFIRLFRHYTKGGYLVVNDQCSENIVLEVRRRLNCVFNLMHFKKRFFIFYTVKIRNISISEEIKTIEEQDTEDNMTVKFGVMLSRKTYDTYCYSDRYITVPKEEEKRYKKLKKNKLLEVTKKEKKEKFTTSQD